MNTGPSRARVYPCRRTLPLTAHWRESLPQELLEVLRTRRRADSIALSAALCVSAEALSRALVQLLAAGLITGTAGRRGSVYALTARGAWKAQPPPPAPPEPDVAHSSGPAPDLWNQTYCTIYGEGE